MNLRNRIRHNVLNILGWHTNRHIIVIESDDWGAIRIPSNRVYRDLVKAGYKVDINTYERYDSLATENDLNDLFNILSKYRDNNGNPPIITANCAVTNPDFPKIKDSGYKDYYYEYFTETLSRYKGCERSFNLWLQGLTDNIFKPQFHAREHLNVSRWMHMLQQGDKDVLYAFDKNMMGISPKNNYQIGDVCQVAYDDTEFKQFPLNEIVSEGLDIFEKIFGYKSETVIAPCYTWSPELENVFYDKGVKGIQGVVYQRIPGESPVKHWMGTKNKFGQVYTIRNCFFEPTLRPEIDNVDDCMYRIKCAFRWGKPAIISSHRINYISSVNNDTHEGNLRSLDNLITQILKNYPDVEFMSTDKLVNFILEQ